MATLSASTNTMVPMNVSATISIAGILISAIASSSLKFFHQACDSSERSVPPIMPVRGSPSGRPVFARRGHRDELRHALAQVVVRRREGRCERDTREERADEHDADRGIR